VSAGRVPEMTAAIRISAVAGALRILLLANNFTMPHFGCPVTDFLGCKYFAENEKQRHFKRLSVDAGY
jgi:hypothetical protein